MNAFLLKREIEILFGLGPLEAANLWRAARSSPPPAGPVPIPYPNISAGNPVTLQGTGSRFGGQYAVTHVSHRIGQSDYQNTFTCISAAVADDPAALRIWPLWLRVKEKLGQLPPRQRTLIAHEITHTLQQGAGRI
ncbi:hypothetical protein [Devosia nitrariae]|uniref:Uncharacterized protein n=1 Tax=Devosia nitrariae TaxID=2071872 RepID=A0ABQ5VZX5_9HYPH|nr:hypothetical protein [Devosia nitrariae]GLQ53003.1 hypothetical protein GCM10010862_02610 [Devosia nitrariae]